MNVVAGPSVAFADENDNVNTANNTENGNENVNTSNSEKSASNSDNNSEKSTSENNVDKSTSDNGTNKSTSDNTPTLNLDSEANSVKENQLPDSSFIYDTSILSLSHADAYYNKMTVQVVGEAVGDVIGDTNIGSDSCWVSLWDANETVSVFMSNKDAQLIDTLGSSHRSGTKLQVRGTFHISCEDHDGISDLHAEHVSVQQKGYETQEEFSVIALLPGVLLLLVGFALLIAFRRLRERNL